MPVVAFVIPALNEEEPLAGVLREVRGVPASGWTAGEVVVADNGSTDGTARVATQGGARVVAAPRRGYGSACQAGLRWLAGHAPPDVVVILDADGADIVTDLPLLLAPILGDQADLVLAARERPESGALLPHQRAGNALATGLIALVSGHRYRDMGPFRAIRWSALERLQMEDPTWGWNVEMQLKAVQRGLRVLEVPSGYRRRVGVSKISGTLSGTLRAGYRVLWAVHRYRA